MVLAAAVPGPDAADAAFGVAASADHDDAVDDDDDEDEVVWARKNLVLSALSMQRVSEAAKLLWMMHKMITLTL